MLDEETLYGSFLCNFLMWLKKAKKTKPKTG
jgi:hypothetical protein